MRYHVLACMFGALAATAGEIPATVRTVAAPKGVRAAWVLDAGKPVAATGLRFRADASRRYCRTPGAASVFAVETADGTGARRALAHNDRHRSRGDRPPHLQNATYMKLTGCGA